MRSKRLLAIVLFLVVALAAYVIGAYASGPIRIIVNGQEIYPDVRPQIIDGRVMVPIRAVSVALDATVRWDSSTNTVFITKSTSVPDTVIPNLNQEFNTIQRDIDYRNNLIKTWGLILENNKVAVSFFRADEYKLSKGSVYNLNIKEKEIEQLMTSLKNPPSTYNKAYDEIFDLYLSHLQCIAIMKNPPSNINLLTTQLNDVFLKIHDADLRLRAILNIT